MNPYATLVDFILSHAPAEAVLSFRASEEGQALTRFFNPRKYVWSEHFRLLGGFIEPLTAIARVTVAIFKFNDQIRLPDRGIF